MYDGSRLGKNFSANNFNKLFNEKEFTFSFSREIQNESISNDLQIEQDHTPTSKGALIEQAFGITSFQQHGPDYEEEAFQRRIKKRRKRKAGEGGYSNLYKLSLGHFQPETNNYSNQVLEKSESFVY